MGVGWLFWIAFGLYSLNLLVGLAAQLRLGHFGVWHHLLYLVVFLSAAAALLWLQEWFLLITVACLAVFPKARPRTWIHPTLGIVGLLGYIMAIVR